MRQLSIALGTCVAALAVTAGPALAQNTTPSTYQAARAAGAAAQKVAPPNLVLPADMGGGTYSQRMTNPNVNNTNEAPPLTPNNITGSPQATTPADNNSNASTPNGTPNNTGMHGASLTPNNSGQTTPPANANSSNSGNGNAANGSNNTASPPTKPGG